MLVVMWMMVPHWGCQGAGTPAADVGSSGKQGPQPADWAEHVEERCSPLERLLLLACEL